MDRIQITKGTVQETLVIPLYGRKLCTERFPKMFQDEAAVALMERLDYDFSALERKSDGLAHVFGAIEVAMRQKDLAWEVKDYLEKHPKAAVVNLGCGLDQTGRSCDNGLCRIYNIDFPSVIEARNLLLPPGEREVNLAADLNDFGWFDQIDASEGAVFFAAGVFYYFRKKDALDLIFAMSKRFKGGKLVFDSCGKLALKMMLKTWLKEANIHDVGAYFYVARISDIDWGESILPSARGYMTGYYPMDDPNIKWVHRYLAWVGDRMMKMKIVRLDFV